MEYGFRLPDIFLSFAQKMQMLPLVRHWRIGVVAALAALLVFQAAAWSLALSILQYQAKTAAHAALHRRETPLQTVTLAAGFLSKIRVGKKEIRLDGKLYDIKNQIVAGDSVKLLLYHDRYEEALLDGLDNLFVSGGNNSGAAQIPNLENWLAKWFGATYLLPETPELIQRQDIFFRHFFISILPVAQAEPDCFSPPPEFHSAFV